MEDGSGFRTVYGLMKQYGGGGYSDSRPLTDTEINKRYRELRREDNLEALIKVVPILVILALVGYCQAQKEAYNEGHNATSSQTIHAPNKQDSHKDYQPKPKQHITIYKT